MDRFLSPSTLRRIHSTLVSALNAAQRRGLLEHNPASLVELPRVHVSERPTWTSEELGCFLEHVQRDELYPIFALLGLSGLRRGEALALRAKDVDLQRGLLRIWRSAVKVGGSIIVGDLKTRGSRRTIAIDTRTSEVLRAHLLVRGRAEPADVGDLLFANSAGEPLDPAYVSRRFDRLIATFGLPKIRLHDLRHTSASIGLEAGESLLEVSRRLGHSSITVTADTYSHIAPHVSHHSARRLADLIYPKETNYKEKNEQVVPYQ